MNMNTEKSQKILFVGTERDCHSIAYVLDIKNYELINRLTTEQYNQFQNYQIYICAFKCKSKKLVSHKILKITNSLLYLDDICRLIDAESTKQTKEISVKQTSVTDNVQIATHKQNKPHTSLIKRIIRGMKHPLRSTWHVLLHIRWRIKKFNKNLSNKIKRTMHEYLIKHYQLNKINYNCQNYLRNLKPSELFLYVLKAPINPHLNCNLITDELTIFEHKMVGCCNILLPFGDLLSNGEISEIYNSTYARIIKLSSLNHSYCLCNLNCWCTGYCHQANSPQPMKQLNSSTVPYTIILGYDKQCNLACKSCRNGFYSMDEKARQSANIITDKLLRSGWLEQTDWVTFAGAGEVFYSPYYRQLLAKDIKRKQITILSNGTLFNQSNWQLIANKYKSIFVCISVDAATAETYQKLRGADFNNLLKNLDMIANLRRQNQIKVFKLCFVVQRDNFHEMPAFIELAHKFNVDEILFQKMNDWGHLSKQEYLKKSLIVDNKYLDYDLWCVLQNPIFKDPIIDLVGLQRYIDASNKIYIKRYNQEHKRQSI